VRVIGERQVLMVAIKGQLYLLSEHRLAKFENIDQDGLHEAGSAQGLRMIEASTVSERATGDGSTRFEERAFGEVGSTFEAHARFRQSATARQRNWRRNKRMGLGVRPVRLSRKQAQKLVELGYASTARATSGQKPSRSKPIWRTV
jgi:hypothetical protein